MPSAPSNARRFVVELSDGDFAALEQRARNSRRTHQDEAAVMLETALHSGTVTGSWTSAPAAIHDSYRQVEITQGTAPVLIDTKAPYDPAARNRALQTAPNIGPEILNGYSTGAGAPDPALCADDIPLVDIEDEEDGA